MAHFHLPRVYVRKNIYEVVFARYIFFNTCLSGLEISCSQSKRADEGNRRHSVAVPRITFARLTKSQREESRF
jgi:hypothetical protein